MSINKPKWAATNSEIEAAIGVAMRAAEMFREMAKAAELLGVSLDEVKRYRKALADETAPLDWSRFVEEVRQEDSALAAALDGARPARFALGDVSLCVEKGIDYAMLSIKRETLTERLQNRYGCSFKVRIRQQL